MKFKLGTDPEVFLKEGNEFVSAAGLFPGTKHEPFPIDGGAIQVDGMALEFNINPASSAEEFSNNIERVLNQMKDMVKAVSKDLSINFTPFAEFNPDYFARVDFDAKILGCEPDFTFEGEIQTPPDHLMEAPFRTAAGHVHIGFCDPVEDVLEDKHFNECIKLSKLFSTKKFFVAQTPLEKKRIELYGRNGAFRPKPYGVELRSPSNIWVANPSSRMEMFNVVAAELNGV